MNKIALWKRVKISGAAIRSGPTGQLIKIRLAFRTCSCAKIRSTVLLGRYLLPWHGRRNQRNFRQPVKPYAFNFVIRVNRIPGRKSTLRRVRISHEMPNDRSARNRSQLLLRSDHFLQFPRKGCRRKRIRQRGTQTRSKIPETPMENSKARGRDAELFPPNDRVRWKKGTKRIFLPTPLPVLALYESPDISFHRGRPSNACYSYSNTELGPTGPGIVLGLAGSKTQFPSITYLY